MIKAEAIFKTKLITRTNPQGQIRTGCKTQIKMVKNNQISRAGKVRVNHFDKVEEAEKSIR